MSEQGYEREQPQKRRRRSTPDRHLRPLPLGFEPHMPARLLEGHLQLPAHHEPRDDLLRIGFEVGTKEGLGFEPSFRIADQNPTDGHGGQTRRVPRGSRRSDLHRTVPATIPVGDLGGLPDGARIFGRLGEVGQTLALYARSAYLMGTSWRGRGPQGGGSAETGGGGGRGGEVGA